MTTMVQWFELRKRNTDFTFEFTKSHKSILRLKEPLKNTEEENYPNCIFRVDSGEWRVETHHMRLRGHTK